MIKTLGKALVLSLFVSALAVVPAIAATPTLSAYMQGSNVQITVSNANANSQIDLYFQPQGSTLWNSVSNIGRTDYSGYFTQPVSLGNTGISQAYVIVGGIQSSAVTLSGNGYNNNNGCTYNCGSPYGLSLSQTTLSLNSGQSSTVTIYNNGSYSSYNNFYISSNSNSSVANASISGNSVNVYGSQSGSTTISVCQSGGNSGCASIYVTVNGNNNGGCTYNCTGTGNVWFSPSTPSLYVGQSLAISINSSASGANYNGSNAYYISSNSNSNVVSATVSGTVLNLYANQSGTSSISVCQNSLNFCGTLYVTVSGSNGCTYNCSGSGTLTLSQANINVNVGQTAYVGISYSGNNNNNNFYISSNSNSSAASASVSGNQLIVQGLNGGSTTINICANSNSGVCASVYVTVGGCSYGNCGSGSLSLSQSNLSLNSGQSASVTAYNYGGGSLYVSSNSNPSVVSANMSGSTINFYGITSGSSTIMVCAGNSTQCGTVYVTVNGNGGNCGYYGCGGSLSLSQSTVSVNLGQDSAITITGNGYYTISSNSSPNVVSATISGSILNIHGQNPGSTTLSICQNGTSQCSNVYVTVNGYNYGGGYGGYGGTISLSQTNLSLSQGQSAAVSIYGNGGNYYISSNSNSGVASASLNGSTLNVYALSSGSSTMSICQNNGSGCASVYVTVGGGYAYNGGGGVLGASTYANGALISENGTVYIVYKNTKTGFISSSIFTGLGFSFGNVINVGYSGLTDSGYTVRTAYAAHPWGSWIKSGSTVYFVHDSGLIPVPDWNTFLNNGGQANLIVNANTYDFRLPMLSSMVSGDSRLH